MASNDNGFQFGVNILVPERLDEFIQPVYVSLHTVYLLRGNWTYTSKEEILTSPGPTAESPFW